MFITHSSPTAPATACVPSAQTKSHDATPHVIPSNLNVNLAHPVQSTPSAHSLFLLAAKSGCDYSHTVFPSPHRHTSSNKRKRLLWLLKQSLPMKGKAQQKRAFYQLFNKFQKKRIFLCRIAKLSGNRILTSNESLKVGAFGEQNREPFRLRI